MDHIYNKGQDWWSDLIKQRSSVSQRVSCALTDLSGFCHQTSVHCIITQMFSQAALYRLCDRPQCVSSGHLTTRPFHLFLCYFTKSWVIQSHKSHFKGEIMLLCKWSNVIWLMMISTWSPLLHLLHSSFSTDCYSPSKLIEMFVCFQERSPEAVGHLCPEGSVPEDVLHLHPSVRQQRGAVRRAVQEKPCIRRRRQRVWGTSYYSYYCIAVD